MSGVRVGARVWVTRAALSMTPLLSRSISAKTGWKQPGLGSKEEKLLRLEGKEACEGDDLQLSRTKHSVCVRNRTKEM